jgi:hypothetical protein
MAGSNDCSNLGSVKTRHQARDNYLERLMRLISEAITVL